MDDRFPTALLSKYTKIIPPEYDWFGPLVGDWNFTYYDHRKKSGAVVTGQWLFRRVLQGAGVEDLLISPSLDAPDGDVETGGAYAASIRMYNPKKLCYDVTYCSRQRTLCLSFFREGSKLVGTTQENPNEKWVFSDIRDNSFQWHKVTVLENGAWRTDCSIHATRS